MDKTPKKIKRIRTGIGWVYFRTKNDVYIIQLKPPFFSIYRTYYSEDAGLMLGYVRYAIPKKYEQERPL